jgi:branched-chain amino acid transport system substrate-binding protein
MTKNLSRRSVLKGAAAVGAAGSLPMMPFAAEAAGDIIVGGLHDLSGFLDFAGIPMNQIMLMAIDEINESGGLLGKKSKKRGL